MANTIFEQMGGTYTQAGDYMLPDLYQMRLSNDIVSNTCFSTDYML